MPGARPATGAVRTAQAQGVKTIDEEDLKPGWKQLRVALGKAFLK